MSKRIDYLSWGETFMMTAFVMAQRSKDPNTQVGAVIVNEHHIIQGVGYNGYPRGISDDKWAWEKSDKYKAVVHAEMNAIINSTSHDLSGCKLYVTMFPCNECAKIIIQKGITEVIYCDMKHYDGESCETARKLFDMAGVKYRRFVPMRDIRSRFRKNYETEIWFHTAEQI